MKKQTNFLFAITCVILIGCKGCDKSHVQEPVIVNHPTFHTINTIGRIIITASCPSDEAMIGGGYKIPNFHRNLIHARKESDKSYQEIFDGTNNWTDDATDCDKFQSPLIVEASYPSSLNTWTVIIFNPDVQNNCYHSGDLIQVDCYSIKSNIVRVKTEIDSVKPHRTDVVGAKPMLTDTCNCPPGATVTAGGFKMQPTDDSKWASLGAISSPLYGSYPYVNSEKKAIGWATNYSTTVPNPPVVLTTYVLCSTSGRIGNNLVEPLADGPVKVTEVFLPVGAGNRTGQTVCDQGYFSTGGGHRVIYGGDEAPVLAVPHGIPTVASASAIINGNDIPYAGWNNNYMGAYNAGYYRWGTTENDSIYTIQLKNLPQNIEVGITNPANGICISGEYNEGGSSVAEFHFKGYAFDHDGTPITGDNLVWTVEGAPNGKGAEYVTSIDANSGHFNNISLKNEYTVTLTATGKAGDKATASITLVDCYPIVNVP